MNSLTDAILQALGVVYGTPIPNEGTHTPESSAAAAAPAHEAAKNHTPEGEDKPEGEHHNPEGEHKPKDGHPPKPHDNHAGKGKGIKSFISSKFESTKNWWNNRAFLKKSK